MSGLGLEPRWLLNRCFTEIKLVIVIIEVSVRVMYMINVDYFIPCQVLKKEQAKEGKETIEAIKVKEASLEVDGGKCWKKIGLRILSVTGFETSQELRKLSSVTINCQVTKIVVNLGSQLSEL